jgi:hypothetical protein
LETRSPAHYLRGQACVSLVPPPASSGILVVVAVRRAKLGQYLRTKLHAPVNAASLRIIASLRTCERSSGATTRNTLLRRCVFSLREGTYTARSNLRVFTKAHPCLAVGYHRHGQLVFPLCAWWEVTKAHRLLAEGYYCSD